MVPHHASERRLENRHPILKSDCKILRAVEQGPWPGVIRDISPQGVGLYTNQAFKPGTILDVRLPVRVGENLGKPRLMRIHNCQPVPHKKLYRLGASFLTPLTREELASLPTKITQIANQERRRATRLRANTRLPCRLIHAQQDGPWHSLVRNVSRRGISLVTDQSFKEGMMLTVELPTKKLGERWLFRVHHVQSPSGKWWLVGGRFARDLGRDDLHALI